MTVEIVAAAAGVDSEEWSGVAVINGGQRGVVIWQILRKFTAAVTTGGRYLSSVLNGNDPGEPPLSDWK